MNNVHLTRALAACVLAAAVTATPTRAVAGDFSDASQASQLSAQGSATVVKGSLTFVTGSADTVVTSAQVVGETLVIGLKGVARAGEVILSIPLAILGGTSVAVGETVTLVSEGVGWTVKSAGRVIGFVPNKAGRALLDSEIVQGDPT